ncbi:MAG: hypothetical protein LBG76_07435 [Treponema sp.]|jgi:hypothetical protein|nr:hypothetical protein [Treponema sp.]
MKKVFAALTALAIAAGGGAGTAFAQDAGQWKYNGGFSGGVSAALPEGSFQDAWDNGTVTSLAGAAYLKLAYIRRAWNVDFTLSANETGFGRPVFTFNWASDAAGFLAATSLGIDTNAGWSLGTLKASALKSWLFLLDRQLEFDFVYNSTMSEVYKTPRPDNTWPEAVLGAAGGSDGSFRIVAAPQQFPVPVKFGMTVPIPLAAQESTMNIDEVVGKTRFFAGLTLPSFILRAGYHLAPEESTQESGGVLGMSYRNFLYPGLNLYDYFSVRQVNHWENQGAVNNWFGVNGIPVPGTKGLTLTHKFTYVNQSAEMTNTAILSTVIPAGPITIDPMAQFMAAERANELKSEIAFSYLRDPFIPGAVASSIAAKLYVMEAGLHTHAGPRPDTVITVKPQLEFYTTLVPLIAGFQIDAGVPIATDLTDPDKSNTSALVKSMLMFNVARQSIGRDADWDGQDNAIWIIANFGYDFTKDLLSTASLAVTFRILW